MKLSSLPAPGHCLVPCAFVIALAAPLAAQSQDTAPIRQVDRWKAPTAGAGDHFGQTLASAGDWMAVAAPQHSTPNPQNLGVPIAAEAGCVYVSKQVGGAWLPWVTLTANTQREHAHFGAALAMTSDVLVVGAPDEDLYTYNPANWPTVHHEVGAVHVYRRSGNTWVYSAFLHPSPTQSTEFGRFGSAVAVSGNFLAVGAPFASATGTGQPGLVHIYEWDGSAWLPFADLEGSDLSEFGSSLALQGNLLAIGAPGADPSQGSLDQAGQVFVYSLQTNPPDLLIDLAAPAVDSYDRFGESLLWSNNLLVVGCPGDDGVPGDPTSGADPDSGALFEIDLLAGLGAAPVYTKVPGLLGLGHSLAADGTLLAAGAQGIGGERPYVGDTDGGAVQLFGALTAGARPALWTLRPGDCEPGEVPTGLAFAGGLLFAGSPLEDSAPGADPSDTSLNDSGAVYVWQPETIWGEYCAPEFPNSSAQFGHLLWVGSPGVSDADFTLAATSLPSGQFGLFLSAREAAWIPLGPPGLNLCLGGPQGYGRLMQTLGTTGTGGYLISQVSLSQLATAQGPTAAQPGETWYFQAWCRDGSASHLTSALAIQFQ